MKKVKAKTLIAESKQKEDDLRESINRLSSSGDFQNYQEIILSLADRIKEDCVRSSDIELVRRLQAQYALLISIWNIGEISTETRESERPE